VVGAAASGIIAEAKGKPMTIRRIGASLLLMAGIFANSGCMSKNCEEAMARPQRPAELDRLNMMLGTWETTAEMKMEGNDEVMKGTGQGTATWECDGWCLVERGTYDMGGDMGKMQGISIWTWDAKAKKYRTFWVDSMGSADVGTGTYDEKTKTWKMSGTSRTPMGKAKTHGTAKVVDDKTMEWTFSQRVGPFGMFKMMDMKGTSRKK
jgi:hypothetical protein